MVEEEPGAGGGKKNALPLRYVVSLNRLGGASLKGDNAGNRTECRRKAFRKIGCWGMHKGGNKSREGTTC